MANKVSKSEAEAPVQQPAGQVEEGKKNYGWASVRMSDETKKKLKQIQKDEGLTSEALYEMLSNLYELSKAKKVLPGRATEIENFRLKLNELLQAYLFCLQINADTDERVRAEYISKLESKDELIENQGKRLKGAEEAAAAANTAAFAMENDLAKAKAKIAEQKAYINEKEAALKALLSQEATYKAIRAESEDLKKKLEEKEAAYAKVREDMYTLHEMMRKAEQDKEKADAQYKEQIRDLEAAHKEALASAAMQAERALHEEALRHAGALAAAEAPLREELRKADAKAADLSSRCAVQEAEIRHLREENDRLRNSLEKAGNREG